MSNIKYPRTYHLPFSPGTTKDDKKLQGDWFSFYKDKEIIVSEKLDGENTTLCQEGVFARSHATPTHSPWSVNLWGENGLYWKVKPFIGKDEYIVGENLYGVHSIEYDKLTNYFHLFAAHDNERWYSWDEIRELSKILEIPTVPFVTVRATSEEYIERLINELMMLPSAYGKTKEGIVIRVADSFKLDDFPNYVCKWVRPNHVQTDEHWTKNWHKATLITNNI
jgi:hypothetical protein